MTGEVIAGASMGAAPTEAVEVGGLTWAYRSNQAAASPDKLPVLCLHGIGSSSYSYRNTLRLLGEAGHQAFAPDWVGHGATSKPGSGFDYSQESYVKALAEFVAAVGIRRPFAVVVHGFVLGQFGLLYALSAADDVEKLVILDTPLSVKSKLRPELAAYKAPLSFMRPKPDAKFDGFTFNAAGSAYAMQYKDAEAYGQPYADGAASAAVYQTMDRLDWAALLRDVDEGYRSWRKPSLVVVGGADPFLDLPAALSWLDSKRTCMRMASGIEARLGHCPQEDYAEALHPALLKFLKE